MLDREECDCGAVNVAGADDLVPVLGARGGDRGRAVLPRVRVPRAARQVRAVLLRRTRRGAVGKQNSKSSQSRSRPRTGGSARRIARGADAGRRRRPRRRRRRTRPRCAGCLRVDPVGADVRHSAAARLGRTRRTRRSAGEGSGGKKKWTKGSGVVGGAAGECGRRRRGRGHGGRGGRVDPALCQLVSFLNPYFRSPKNNDDTGGVHRWGGKPVQLPPTRSSRRRCAYASNSSSVGNHDSGMVVKVASAGPVAHKWQNGPRSRDGCRVELGELVRLHRLRRRSSACAMPSRLPKSSLSGLFCAGSARPDVGQPLGALHELERRPQQQQVELLASSMACAERALDAFVGGDAVRAHVAELRLVHEDLGPRRAAPCPRPRSRPCTQRLY